MRKKEFAYTLYRLIILAGFQVFFVLLLFEALLGTSRHHYGFVRLALPSDESKNGYSRYSLAGELKNKIITTVNLSGGEEQDGKLLDTVDIKVRDLNVAHDTTHVIKVHFTVENTYGQFVRLINIAHIEQTERYSLLDDDFYFFGNPKEDIPTDDSGKIIRPVYL